MADMKKGMATIALICIMSLSLSIIGTNIGFPITSKMYKDKKDNNMKTATDWLFGINITSLIFLCLCLCSLFMSIFDTKMIIVLLINCVCVFSMAVLLNNIVSYMNQKNTIIDDKKLLISTWTNIICLILCILILAGVTYKFFIKEQAEPNPDSFTNRMNQKYMEKLGKMKGLGKNDE